MRWERENQKKISRSLGLERENPNLVPLVWDENGISQILFTIGGPHLMYNGFEN